MRFHKIKSEASVNKEDSRPIVIYEDDIYPHPLDNEESPDESLGDQPGKSTVECLIDVSVYLNL